MQTKLAILGGSSPFTVALIDALADASTSPAPAASMAPMWLALTGRNQEHLALVHAYASSRLAPLGWRCQASTDAPRMLDGAQIVIHQNRYGGLALRAAGERMCHKHGLLADETLGPAALLTALLGRPALERTIDLIVRHCPLAFVLNLSNPLSLVTAKMAGALPNCIGLCELPAYTARTAAAVLDLVDGATDSGDSTMHWDYHGLNHRGFLINLSCRDEDVLPRLIDALTANAASGRAPTTIGGITADCIADLGAVPLKYFSQFTHPAHTAPARAPLLARLREQILQQLRHDSSLSPPAAQQRYQAWYPLAVVPMLRALECKQESIQVLNLLRDDSLAWEVKAPVSRAGIGLPLMSAPAGPAVTSWLRRFQDHEQAAMRALDAPSRRHLLTALQTDPSIPETRVGALMEALLPEIERAERSEHAHT